MLIDAMASRNKPPRLIAVGDATIPLFGDDYDWSEQQRVARRGGRAEKPGRRPVVAATGSTAAMTAMS